MDLLLHWIFIIVMVVILTSIFGFVFYDNRVTIRDFWCWLKGSRLTYYQFSEGPTPNNIETTTLKLRTRDRQRGSLYWSVRPPVIEISRGLFRRRSAIYGTAHWRITKSWKENGLDFVSLENTEGLQVNTALQLTGEYPMFQSMLGQIDTLKDLLAKANERGAERLAALRALDEKISGNKQRFRSPVAKEIHANIQFALREIGVIDIVRQPVDLWLEKFSRPETGALR